MAIRKMTPKADAELVPAPVMELVTVDEFGPTEASYANLETALGDFEREARSGEAAKVKMARIVDAIDRQQLYKEAGVDSMKGFFPILLTIARTVGWKSDTSVKRYLAWYRLYIRELGFNPTEAIVAASHLHHLKVLAELDRKSGELLPEPEKDGKLGGPEFEEVSRLVTYLVNGPTAEMNRNGLAPEALAAVLPAGMDQSAATYEKLMGRPVSLPAGGWTLADTQELIDRVKGAEEETEEEDETTVRRVWVGSFDTMNNLVHVDALEFRRGEAVVDSIQVDKPYSQDQFKLVAGKDDTEIEGLDEGEEE